MSTVQPSVTWVFTRGEESVHLLVIDRGNEVELRVTGPGTAGTTYTFPSRDLLIDFQTKYERRLLARGYALFSAGGDRRTQPDRRRTRRPGRDRRRPS